MAWERCKKCGGQRKVDIIWTKDGWLQPKCYNCGDPSYLEDLDTGEVLEVYDLEEKYEREEDAGGTGVAPAGVAPAGVDDGTEETRGLGN